MILEYVNATLVGGLFMLNSKVTNSAFLFVSAVLATVIWGSPSFAKPDWAEVNSPSSTIVRGEDKFERNSGFILIPDHSDPIWTSLDTGLNIASSRTSVEYIAFNQPVISSAATGMTEITPTSIEAWETTPVSYVSRHATDATSPPSGSVYVSWKVLLASACVGLFLWATQGRNERDA